MPEPEEPKSASMAENPSCEESSQLGVLKLHAPTSTNNHRPVMLRMERHMDESLMGKTALAACRGEKTLKEPALPAENPEESKKLSSMPDPVKSFLMHSKSQIIDNEKQPGSISCQNSGALVGAHTDGNEVAGKVASGDFSSSDEHNHDDALNDAECGKDFSHDSAKRRKNFSKEVTRMLKFWFFQHILHPYPDEIEKQQLALQAGITTGQVAYWFVNTRKRVWRPILNNPSLAYKGAKSDEIQKLVSEMDTSKWSDPISGIVSWDAQQKRRALLFAGEKGLKDLATKRRKRSRAASSLKIKPGPGDDVIHMLFSGGKNTATAGNGAMKKFNRNKLSHQAPGAIIRSEPSSGDTGRNFSPFSMQVGHPQPPKQGPFSVKLPSAPLGGASHIQTLPGAPVTAFAGAMPSPGSTQTPALPIQNTGMFMRNQVMPLQQPSSGAGAVHAMLHGNLNPTCAGFNPLMASSLQYPSPGPLAPSFNMVMPPFGMAGASPLQPGNPMFGSLPAGMPPANAAQAWNWERNRLL